MANIYTNDQHEFWGDRAWPNDDPVRGYTFLARAMLKIGGALFRDEWIGTEPYLSLSPRALPILPEIPKPLLRLPAQPEAKAEDAKAAPDDGPWWRRDFLASTTIAPAPLAIERDEEGERILAQARARWDEVMDITVRCLNGGRLKSAWRGLLGGAYYEIPDTDWNSENPFYSWAPRFLLCRIDPRRSFTTEAAGPAFIYVSTETLQDLLAALDRCHPEGPLCATQPPEASHVPSEILEDGGKPKPKVKAFKDAFEAMIRANPNEKKMNREAGAAWAQADFNLGPTQYRTAREFVFSKLRDEGFEHVYDQSGAPRKERG